MTKLCLFFFLVHLRALYIVTKTKMVIIHKSYSCKHSIFVDLQLKFMLTFKSVTESTVRFDVMANDYRTILSTSYEWNSSHHCLCGI